MESILIRALQLVVSLSILVVIHEFGHFMFAKIFGVRVEKFYLFFNPWFSLFKYKPKNSETEYGVGWVPLGGYVKLSGMIDESMDKEQLSQPEQPWEFRSKPAWQRLLIMVGGVLMNFILAFFIYSMVLFTWGEHYLPLKNKKMGLSYNEFTQKAGFRNGDLPVAVDGAEIEEIDMKTLFSIASAKEITVLRNGEKVNITLPEGFDKVIFEKSENFVTRYPYVVESLVKGNPAAQAGLQNGDSIVGVGESTSMVSDEITKVFAESKLKPVTINLYRNSQLIQTSITPNEDGKIGVYQKQPEDFFQTVRVSYGFFESFPAGIKLGISTIKGYLSQFKFLFTKEGAQSLGGFGTIGTFFPSQWDWHRFWTMTAFLSIILGVMNLLPIPALDGGHVMFLLYEVVTRRKPNEKFMEYAQIAGMVLILGLVLYANGNDIIRFIFKK